MGRVWSGTLAYIVKKKSTTDPLLFELVMFGKDVGSLAQGRLVKLKNLTHEKTRFTFFLLFFRSIAHQFGRRARDGPIDTIYGGRPARICAETPSE